MTKAQREKALASFPNRGQMDDIRREYFTAALARTPATREALLRIPPTTVKQAAKRALRFKLEVYEHDALLNAARVQAFAVASNHCE